MRRRPGAVQWWTGLLLAATLVASACTSSDDDDDEGTVTSIPAPSTLLRVASEAWPSCLNPLTCDDEVARSLVFEHVLPKLMEVDELGRYVPGPLLAGTPEVRVDEATGEQTVVYVLAEDARWHDGRPVTSSDITGTWLARRDTPGARTRGHDLITAVDDRNPLVARVTMSAAWADWPELFGGLGGWLLQADAFGGDTDLTGRFEDSLPFGAGPWELVSFEERSLVLLARDAHWDAGRQAAIDQVRIEHTPGLTADAAGTGELVRPGVDVVLPATTVEDVPPRFRVRDVPTTDVVGLFFDRRTAPLGSEAVRAAIGEALDRRELVALVGEDPPAVLTCLGGLPQEPVCDEADLPAENAFPAVADALLDADGWARDAVGGRSRPGLALSAPVTRDPLLPGAAAIADAVADALIPLGFGTAVVAVPAADWTAPGRTNGLGAGIYAVALGTAERLAALYGCSPGTRNPMAWCDDEVQELVDDLLVAVDPVDRSEVQDELGDLAADVAAWLPLHQRMRQWLVDPSRIESPERAPLGAGPLGNLHAFARSG